MYNLKRLERLQLIHQRIQNETTGTPVEIARRMNISQRSFHNLINEMKILGANICYCRRRRTYYYCNDFSIELSISLKVITEGEAKNLYGGSYFLKKTASLQGNCSERN